MDVVSPNLVLRLRAVDDDIGVSAIAPVEDDDSVTALGDLGREQFDAANIAAPPGRERDPWATIAENFIIHIDAANFGDGHRDLP
jgi:hypothetical protein